MSNRESIKTLLNSCHLRFSSEEKKDTKCFINNSYNYQRRIANGQWKERFSTDIVRLSLVDNKFVLKVPEYISLALEDLRQYFEGDAK